MTDLVEAHIQATTTEVVAHFLAVGLGDIISIEREMTSLRTIVEFRRGRVTETRYLTDQEVVEIGKSIRDRLNTPVDRSV